MLVAKKSRSEAIDQGLHGVQKMVIIRAEKGQLCALIAELRAQTAEQ
jgi:hypothetical protein